MEADWTIQQGAKMDSLDLAGFGAILSAMGGGGDVGNSFPQSDADDLTKGARFIPSEVTMARRRGEKVFFVHSCSRNCWYWGMPDGSRIYHFDPLTYRQIGEKNGHVAKPDGYGGVEFENGPGQCPQCGNVHTSGGTVAKGE